MKRLPLHAFTIVLDGMPFLASVFTELNRLSDQPVTWHVVEGACANTHCSKWMNPQQPRLSRDGSSQFIDALVDDPRVKVYRNTLWDGKLAMVSAPLANITEECVLLEIDSDELWGADQIRQIVHLFEDDPELMNARFDCRYFVGPGIETLDEGRPEEWLRAWRFRPGMKWISHEPPNLAGNQGKSLTRKQTAAILGKFDHYSWCLPAQVEAKSKLYGKRYEGALAGWHRMQKHTTFPAKLKDFFPWADRSVEIDRV